MPATLNYSENAALEVAQLIAKIIRENKSATIGLATGSTPIPVYNELIRMHKEDNLDFSQIKTINLDEYYGLSGDHYQSYKQFMYENLFKHININLDNTNFLNGSVKSSEIDTECQRYEKLIQECPPDIWLLGIGNNGHIAFNEPGSEKSSITRLVQLTESTINANKRFFGPGETVPTTSLTVGISSILKAKQLVLLATGIGKKQAVTAAFEAETTECPASFLKNTNCQFWTDFK